jgi:hypothetical protein
MQTKFLPHGTRDAWFAGGSPIALLETWTRSRKPAEAVSDLAETPVRPAPSELLRRSLARGRLGHAYLFQGDSIEALETVAIEFVQALFCTQPVAGPDPGVAPAGTAHAANAMPTMPTRVQVARCTVECRDFSPEQVMCWGPR